jgi:hypothetical protein
MAQHFTFYNRDTGNIEKVILTDQRSANRILDFSDQLGCVDGDYDCRGDCGGDGDGDDDGDGDGDGDGRLVVMMIPVAGHPMKSLFVSRR